MTSRVAASDAGLNTLGIVLIGFPLHGAGRPPGRERAAHLAEVPMPMLFLQGTRDALADLELISGVCADLPRAALHVVEGADHGFHVPKRYGRTDAMVIEELTGIIARWIEKFVSR